MDLIDRKAAIDTAMEELDGGTPYDIPRKIERLPAAQRWIPVTEGLPKNMVCVLVCFREWQQHSKHYMYIIVKGGN